MSKKNSRPMSKQQRRQQLMSKHVKSSPKTFTERINWMWVSCLAVIVVFAILVTVVVVTGDSPSSKPMAGDNPDAVTDAEAYTHSPKNMVNDTFIIGEGGEALSVTDETLPNDATGYPDTVDGYQPRDDGKTTVQVFFDPQCPVCKLFEDTNQEFLNDQLEQGNIVLAYSPISFLDNASTTQYSSRATNAVACVADTNPDSFYGFVGELFEHQPEEGGDGLSNGQLFELADNAGAGTKTVETCIYSKQFGGWVESATDRVLENPIPNTFDGRVEATPTVFINGSRSAAQPNDAAAFQNEVNAAVEAQNKPLS